MNKPIFKPAALGLVVALLGGCTQLPAVGPDYQPPGLVLPKQWTAPPVAEPARELARWWRQLADPVLDGLIDEALASSLDLRLAQSRLRQARAARAQAVSGFFPTLSASTGGQRSKAAQAVSAVPERTIYDAGFDASWEIDLFGGTRRAVEAATADQAAMAASLDNVRVSLVAEVAQNYVELRSYQRRLQIARDNLAQPVRNTADYRLALPGRADRR